jgi:predicted RNA-binding protein with PUA-like domain
MAIWLLKTEPDAYSLADLQRDGTTVWDGVSNNLALKYLRQMQTDDTALIYHTGLEKAWVGVATVKSDPRRAATADSPHLVVVEIGFERTLSHPITLQALKAQASLAGWDLLRLPRLSVVPVTPAQWTILRKMAGI